MIDALLFAVRDLVRGAGWGYDAATCEVVAPPGKPPGRFSGVFVGVCQTPTSSEMDNALDEYFGFDLVLTMSVRVGLDRVGDKMLALAEARRPGPNGCRSFNARAEQLRGVQHMGWATIALANQYMVEWEPGANLVPGFCEPARYRGMEDPYFVGGEWFWANPESDNVGLVAALRFEGARRLQPIASYV